MNADKITYMIEWLEKANSKGRTLSEGDNLVKISVIQIGIYAAEYIISGLHERHCYRIGMDAFKKFWMKYMTGVLDFYPREEIDNFWETAFQPYLIKVIGKMYCDSVTSPPVSPDTIKY
jgi:hypothetical protein